MGKEKVQKLTPKQLRFVDEYLIDLNATQAAIRAGYSVKTAGSVGFNLLKKVEIQDAIAKEKLERSERTQITKDYVITIIRRQYEINSKTFPKVDFAGDPVLGEDGKPVMKQVDAAAANKAAEMLAKHVNLFEADNKRDLSGEIAFAWRKAE